MIRFARSDPDRGRVARPLFALLISGACVGTAFAAEEIPAFSPKPGTWRTGLVTHDDVVWDKVFAEWVAEGEKKAHETVGGTWQLLVRCTFAHCFSGGFVHELNEAAAPTAVPKISDFSANSACRYFETASAYESSTVDESEWFSWYALAWKDRAKAGAAQDPVWSLKEITKRAYNALIDGIPGAVPLNPNIKFEHPQYLSNVAPDDLEGGDLRLAILFAGDPQRRHINNMDQILSVLMDQYDFAYENIWIMCGEYGPGDDVPDVIWGSDAKATNAELEKALRNPEGFVISRISAHAGKEELDGEKVKLFIWTTDHGTVDAPILMSASSDSFGAAGTAVAAQANPAKHMYEGGASTNELFWSPMAGEFDSFSTGNDEVYVQAPPDPYLPTPAPAVYFSVDRSSWGLEDTDVDRAINALREPAAGVFSSASYGDNREFIRGGSVGLFDEIEIDPELGPLPADELTALSTVPAEMIIDFAAMPPVLRQPMFYTERTSAKIRVLDPWHPTGLKDYVYFDPMIDPWPELDLPPLRIDGLSMLVNMAPAKRVPMPGQPGWDPTDPEMVANAGNLRFKTGDDAIVFSVPVGDPFRGSGCTVYRWNGALMQELYSCEHLGLDDDDEVDALHAYVSQPYRSAPSPSSYCEPDLNMDGQVDGNDLAIVLGAWMTSGSISDLNGDGVTDGTDLSILLSAWGPCP